MKYNHHVLKPTSPPLVVDNVSILVAFQSTPHNWNKGVSGAPWHLYVTSEAPADADSLELTGAKVLGEALNESLIVDKDVKKVAYRIVGNNEKWLQINIKKALQGPIAKGTKIQVDLQGVIHRRDKSVPFHRIFEFESVISHGVGEFNPLIDK